MSGRSEVPFKVVHCSSSDDGHSERELENRHSKRGWQSARFCDYPQDLILQFDQEYEIREIRILSHQSKIAAKIHVSVGSGSGVRNTHFKGLGCLTLDPNERSNFKARELKKVHVRAQGNLMKLSILKNHINRINIFAQVAIIGIQILGAPKKGSKGEGTKTQSESGLSARRGASTNIDEKTQSKIMALKELKVRAIEDEDYDKAKKLKMAIEALEKIGPYLAELEKKKKEAVAQEDFDTAMQIKQKIQLIRSGRAGSSVNSQYEPQNVNPYDGIVPPDSNFQNYQPMHPHQPPRNSNPNISGPFQSPSIGHSGSFDNGAGFGRPPPMESGPPGANLGPSPMSNQGAGFPGPNGAYPFAVGAHGHSPAPSPQSNFPANRPGYPPHIAGSHGHGAMQEGSLPRQFPGNGEYPFHAAGPSDVPNPAIRANPNDERPLPTLQKSGNSDFGGQPPPRKVYIDDRPLPALTKKKDANADPFGQGPEDSGPIEAIPDPEPIADKYRQVGDTIGSAFGEQVAARILDSRRPVREAGVQDIEKQLDQKSGSAVRNGAVAMAAVVAVSKRLIGDKAPSLASSACLLLKTALEKMSGSGVADRSVVLLPSLFTKFSNGNAKVRHAALSATRAMLSAAPTAAEKVSKRLLKPIDGKDANKPLVLLSRGNLLLEILNKFSLDSSLGLAPEPIMRISVPLLEHRDAKVRNIGVQIIARVHAIAGNKAVMPYLKDVRQGMRDTLETAFAKNDPPVRREGKRSVNDKNSKGQPAVNQSVDGFQVHGSHGTDGGGEHDDLGDEPAGYCQFCEFQDPAYDEVKMDLHYWGECPMLISCGMCEQVVEIATFNSHLLEECEKSDYIKCEVCSMAIRPSDLKAHQSSEDCKPLPKPEKGSRCPLCFKDIPPWDEGWKRHLLDEQCPKNPRTNGKSEGGKQK